MNKRIMCKICHVTSNLLPHYLAKLDCSATQLYSKVSQFKSDIESVVP